MRVVKIKKYADLQKCRIAWNAVAVNSKPLLTVGDAANDLASLNGRSREITITGSEKKAAAKNVFLFLFFIFYLFFCFAQRRAF